MNELWKAALAGMFAVTLVAPARPTLGQTTAPTTVPSKPNNAAAAADDDDANVTPKSISFDAAAPASVELEVARATSGHLLVRPKVNGEEAGWFIFDTGAGITCIDKALAEKLNLPHGGEITASGMGGERKTNLRQAKSVEFGPITLHDAPLLELDLKPFQIFMGKPIAGVIGYECFGAAIYEVDFDQPKIIVHDPARYELPAGGEWTDLSIVGRRPHVTGSIEGNAPGLFVLDIGSNSALIAHSPTVERFKLLDGRETKRSFSGGVGGLKASRSGTVKTLKICGRELADVETTFSEAKEGATAKDDTQGTIGVGALRAFTLIVNYPKNKIALLPKK